MSSELTGVSSMATKQILAELVASYSAQTGRRVAIESIGGVDAAKRVRAGEAFDVVLLAQDAMQKLEAEGFLAADGCVDFARSPIAVAIPAGRPQPGLANEAEVRSAVEQAQTIGFSTGPSGVYLTKLFEKWGLADKVADRLVKAPPGVPVAALIARGEVALGFQQLSELVNAPGIDIVGLLPDDIQLVTTFVAGVGVHARDAGAAKDFLEFLISGPAGEAKRRQGMQPG